MSTDKSYTKILNSFLEFLYSSKMSASELKVLIFIVRYTASFKRQSHGMSATYISKGTGLDVRTVKRVIKNLEAENLVSVTRDGTHRNTIKLVVKLSPGGGQNVTRSSGEMTTSTSGQMTTQETKEEIKEEIKEYKKENHPLSDEEIRRLQDEDEDEEGYEYI